MNKLIEKIKEIQGKLEGFRRHSLDEIPTRTKIVNPLLVGLGWDISDQEEVEEEYPTFDKQKVDYALKINHKPKPVLLVEAKQLDDPLNDKAVGQVAGYAVRAGILWFVLTDGIKWKVYRIAEGIQPPDMLVGEVSFDPRETDEFSLPRSVEIIGHISKKEVVEGTLDTWGEQTFIDGKVKKALDSIMRDPSRKFLNMLRSDTNDERLMKLGNQKVKDSIARIWAERGVAPQRPIGPSPSGGTTIRPVQQSRKGKKPSGEYDERRHLSGKSKEVVELYLTLESLCLSLAPGNVGKTFAKFYITYDRENSSFCSVLLQKSGLRIFLKLKYSRLQNPPSFARDVSNLGHYGMGDLELRISSISQLKEAEPLIRQSFEGQA